MFRRASSTPEALVPVLELPWGTGPVRRLGFPAKLPSGEEERIQPPSSSPPPSPRPVPAACDFGPREAT